MTYLRPVDPFLYGYYKDKIKLTLYDESVWLGKTYDVSVRSSLQNFHTSMLPASTFAKYGDVITISAKIWNKGETATKAGLIVIAKNNMYRSSTSMLAPGENKIFTVTINTSDLVERTQYQIPDTTVLNLTLRAVHYWSGYPSTEDEGNLQIIIYGGSPPDRLPPKLDITPPFHSEPEPEEPKPEEPKEPVKPVREPPSDKEPPKPEEEPPEEKPPATSDLNEFLPYLILIGVVLLLFFFRR